MSGAMNRHCIPGLTMSTALTGNFSAGVSGKYQNDAHSGFVRTRIVFSSTNVLESDNGRTDVMILARKDLCSGSECFQQ